MYAFWFATAYMGAMASVHSLGSMGLPWRFYAGAWLFMFIAGGLIRSWRARRALSEGERSADIPPPQDPLSGDDGRRWRSGLG